MAHNKKPGAGNAGPWVDDVLIDDGESTPIPPRPQRHDFAQATTLWRNVIRLAAEDAVRRPAITARRAALWAEEMTLAELGPHVEAGMRKLGPDRVRTLIDRLAAEEASS